MEQFEASQINDKKQIPISADGEAVDNEQREKPHFEEEDYLGQEETKENSFISFIKELPLLIIVAFVVAWAIKSFIIQPFFIPSGSMEPTFFDGDHVLVNKFVYRFSKPERGDVIVFKYPLDTSKDYIKRVIAVGGETVEVRSGDVFINGKEIYEPYLKSEVVGSDYGPIKIPANKFFVLGDNRDNSSDSRTWGLLPPKNILGRAVVLYWPLNRVGIVR